MATCRKCGKPLIVKDGKCIYCGDSAQGDSSSGIRKTKTSWIGTMTKTLTSSKKDWTQLTLRKTIISIFISMILGCSILLWKVWPGCFVSITMLIEVIALSVYSFFVINLGNRPEAEDKELIRINLSHLLNLILLWGGFFFVCGIICMFVNWWATLITSIIALCGVVYGVKIVIDTIKR